LYKKNIHTASTLNELKKGKNVSMDKNIDHKSCKRPKKAKVHEKSQLIFIKGCEKYPCNISKIVG